MKKKSSINSKGVIAISHQKGGVGKSTLIWNLITQYSKNEIVDVIDLDVQQTVTYSLAIRKKHNLAVNNINLLNIRDSKDKISDELLLDLMIESQNKGRKLFVDCGGFDSESNRLVMAASDVLITPVSTKFYELHGLKVYETILKRLTEKFRDGQTLIANVVLNKINPNTKELEEISNFINESNYSRYQAKVPIGTTARSYF